MPQPKEEFQLETQLLYVRCNVAVNESTPES